jgi:hypothetical protein
MASFERDRHHPPRKTSGRFIYPTAARRKFATEPDAAPDVAELLSQAANDRRRAGGGSISLLNDFSDTIMKAEFGWL